MTFAYCATYIVIYFMNKKHVLKICGIWEHEVDNTEDARLKTKKGQCVQYCPCTVHNKMQGYGVYFYQIYNYVPIPEK